MYGVRIPLRSHPTLRRHIRLDDCLPYPPHTRLQGVHVVHSVNVSASAIDYLSQQRQPADVLSDVSTCLVKKQRNVNQ